MDGPTPHEPTSHHDHLADEVKFGDTFRRDYPVGWWATLIAPFLLTGALLASLGLTRGWDFVAKLVAAATSSFFVLGRFVILLGSGEVNPALEGHAEDVAKFKFLSTPELFTMVTWMDLCTACILVYHASFIYKIPKLGPRLLSLRDEGQFFLRYQPWIRRFTFIGLSLFVAIPIAATGAIAGSIFGRLLGMTRTATILAICCGTLLGNGVMLALRGVIHKLPFLDPNNPWNLAVGIAVILGIIALLNWRYRKLKKELGHLMPHKNEPKRDAA
ncbi:MAG: small multi-drug export protein [Phycisphaerales bacterium]